MRNAEKPKKPILPSRIPKKGDRSPSRSKQLGIRERKRNFSATVVNHDDAAGLYLKEKEARDARRLLLAEASSKESNNSNADSFKQPLSSRAQELVKLIPTLSGVDVTNLVASIKRRRVQRLRRDTARNTDSRQQQNESVKKKEPQPFISVAPSLLSDQVLEEQNPTTIPDLENAIAARDQSRPEEVSVLMEDLKAEPTEKFMEAFRLPARSLADELSRQTSRWDLTRVIF